MRQNLTTKLIFAMETTRRPIKNVSFILSVKMIFRFDFTFTKSPNKKLISNAYASYQSTYVTSGKWWVMIMSLNDLKHCKSFLICLALFRDPRTNSDQNKTYKSRSDWFIDPCLHLRDQCQKILRWLYCDFLKKNYGFRI